MNFDLSELEKLPEGKGGLKARSLPKFLSKSKPKGKFHQRDDAGEGPKIVQENGEVRGETVVGEKTLQQQSTAVAGAAVQEPGAVVDGLDAGKTSPELMEKGGGAVVEEKTCHGDMEDKKKRRRKENASLETERTREATNRRLREAKKAIFVEKEAQPPTREQEPEGGKQTTTKEQEEVAVLPALKRRRAKASYTKKGDTTLLNTDRNVNGLEELHRALHLSKFEGADDVSKVIKAEPLEERRQRLLEENKVKKKRGRPSKSDSVAQTLTNMKYTQTEKNDDSKDQGPSPGVRRSARNKEVKVYTGEDKEGILEKKNVPNAPKKSPAQDLASQELDSENWSMKQIVKWGNARERKIAKEMQSKNKQEDKSTNAQPPVVEEKGAKSLAPKVHLVDGKVVVDQQSLVVNAQQKEQYTRVVREDVPTVNSMSYVNRLSNDRWSVEDTELFFRALSQFGTDFTLIAQLFPGRQRKHLKKKFCKEGKMNAARVDAALKASANATINSYKEMIVLLKESGMNVSSQTPHLSNSSDGKN